MPSSGRNLPSQRVVSVRNVKDGPRAGFLLVVRNAESGLRGDDSVDELMTRTVKENVSAKVRSCRINAVMTACPCDETALRRGPSNGVTASITTQRIVEPVDRSSAREA